MSQDQADSELRQIFPKLRPIKSAPSMFRLNGFGVSVYGNRDFHEPTQSYVKTHCLCALFIPLLSLGAYRVVDSGDGGWYFLGKVPLSGFAKGWNILVLSAILVFGGAGVWNGYYNSPEARAERNLASAQTSHKAGKFGKAARKYRSVLQSHTSYSTKGALGLEQLKMKLDQMPLKQAKPVVSVLLQAKEYGRYRRTTQISLHQLFSQVSVLTQKHGEKQPRQSYELLRSVAHLTKRKKALRAQQQTLLERVVQQTPRDLEMVSALANIYEKQKKTALCLKVLEPVRGQLRQQEGARILGQIYFRKGKLNAAYKLLLPYTEGRLKKLRLAEKQFNIVNKTVRDRIWRSAKRQLRRRSGASRILGSDYRTLSKKQKQLRYMAYAQKKVRNDPLLNASRKKLIVAARIVPVAMDLGIVMLYRARRVKNTVARRKELKSAERVFLAIRGVAGRSSRYQLYLGQVYYWMGKPRKGQALFDRVLKQTKRSYHVLMRLTSIMRELGEHSRASKLAEEAYKQGKTAKLKHQAAYLRALTAYNLDERIKWLKRSGDGPHITISLNSARGRQSSADGKFTEAATYLKKAIAGYQNLGKTAPNLNNRGLVHFSLFRVTGDPNDYLKGLKLIEEALMMKPSDSIMLGNTALFSLEGALLDVIGKRMDWKSYNGTVDLGLLSFFYKSQKEKKPLLQQFLQNKKLKRSMSRYHKVMVLSPKAAHVYTSVAQVYRHANDVKSMRQLLQRLQSGKFRFLNRNRYRRTLKSRLEDRKTLRKTQRRIKSRKRLVRRLRNRSKVDFAIATNSLLRNYFSTFHLGVRVPARPLVALAERAYRRAPSSATRRSLIRALYFQASERVAKRHTGYARMLKYYKRHISVSDLLIYAMHQNKEVFALLQRDKGIRRAVQLVKRSASMFPDHGYPLEWALVEKFDKAFASTIADRIQKDEILSLYNRLREILSPNSPSVGLHYYFRALSEGKPDKAKRLWSVFRARNAPMPSFNPPTRQYTRPVKRQKPNANKQLENFLK